MSDQRIKGFAFLSLPILGWGIAPIIVEFGLRFLEPLPFLAWRFIVALLISTPIIMYYKRQHFAVLFRSKWTLIVGLAQVWAITTQYLSQLYISPSISATISYSYLILVPFVSRLLLDKKIERIHILAVLIAIVGLLMITSDGDLSAFNTDYRGILLAVLSTFGFATYIVSASRLVTKEIENVDSLALYYIIIFIVSIMGIILALIFGSSIDPMIIPSKGWLYIILLAIFSTIIAYSAYIQSLKYISANIASVLLLLQIVIPYFIEVIFLDASISFWIYMGGLIILFASFILIKFSKDDLH